MEIKKYIETILRQHLNESQEIKITSGENITLIAYHGLSRAKAERLGYGSSIETFNTQGHGSQRVAGTYFSPFLSEAKKYAKAKGDKIYKVELSFKKLGDRKVIEEIPIIKYDGKQTRDILIQDGYDGIWDELMKEIVVFHPNQIRIVETIEV